MDHFEIIILCLIFAITLIFVPEKNFPTQLNAKNRQIIAIISLLIAYYYYNNEKLF
jgi:hypothetical protein